MKRGLNKTEIIGNVGRDDGQLGALPDGTPVLNFSLAVNGISTDKQTGEEQQTTQWFKIAIFGERARKLAPSITSGIPLYLQGRISTTAWNGEDGSAKADLTLRVNELLFLDSAMKRGDSDESTIDGEALETESDDALFPTRS